MYNDIQLPVIRKARLKEAPYLKTQPYVEDSMPMSSNAPAVLTENTNIQQAASETALKEKSSLISRNVTVGTHRTSVRLEPDMWNGLREVCRREHVSMHDIATAVSTRKAPNTSLTAAIRVFVMAYFRAAATEEGHSRAGHGPGGSFMQALIRGRMNEQDNAMMASRDRFASYRVVGMR